MNKKIQLNRIVLIIFALAGTSAAAAEVIITRSGEPCDEIIHLQANNAPLKQVLNKLAQELGFEIRYQADVKSVIDVDVQDGAEQLVTQLTRPLNTVYMDHRVAGCENTRTPVSIWILPEGENTAFIFSEVVNVEVVEPVVVQEEMQAEREQDPNDEPIRKKKSRAQMTPEERYNDRIEKRLRHKYGDKSEGN